MNRKALLEELSYFLDEKNGINAAVYFVLNEGEDDNIRFADIEDTAKAELKSRFLDSIREQFIDNEELNYHKISEADERIKAIYHYDIDQRPESLQFLDDILVNSQRKPFNFKEHSFSNIQGYLITIGNETRKLVLYKKHYPVNLFKRDRFLLIPTASRLTTLDTDAIAIDKSFDFMLIADTLIVLKLSILERFFGFEQVIRSQAQHTIDIVEKLDLLEDIQQLKDLSQSLVNAKKIMRIKSSPVLGMPVMSVINFIDNHPELNGKIAFNDYKSKINLTTAASKKLFLKLLNDDYLFSQLTELQYDSYGKDKLNPEDSH